MANISRKRRRELRQYDQHQSRIENGKLKNKERERRHKLLLEKLESGKVPVHPTILSWLSAALDKPSKQITVEDVEQFRKS